MHKQFDCIPTRFMENIRWHSPSQVLTAKHVLYAQLTATVLTHQVLSISRMYELSKDLALPQCPFESFIRLGTFQNRRFHILKYFIHLESAYKLVSNTEINPCIHFHSCRLKVVLIFKNICLFPNQLSHSVKKILP